MGWTLASRDPETRLWERTDEALGVLSPNRKLSGFHSGISPVKSRRKWSPQLPSILLGLRATRELTDFPCLLPLLPVK
jgi:hypothetical protein